MPACKPLSLSWYSVEIDGGFDDVEELCCNALYLVCPSICKYE